MVNVNVICIVAFVNYTQKKSFATCPALTRAFFMPFPTEECGGRYHFAS